MPQANGLGKYNTGLRRLGAAFVDGLIFTPLIFLDEFVTINYTTPVAYLIWHVSFSLLVYGYSILMHYKYGQTLGKIAARVKVVPVTETGSLSFRQSVLRDIVPMSFDIGGFIYFFLFLKTSSVISEQSIINFETFTSIIAFVWVLLELITMLTNNKRRAIHDLIAKTVVIRTDLQ